MLGIGNKLQSRIGHSQLKMGHFLVFCGGKRDYTVGKIKDMLLFDNFQTKDNNSLFGDSLLYYKQEMLKQYHRNAPNRGLIQIFNIKTKEIYTPINRVRCLSDMPDNPSDLTIHDVVAVNNRIFLFAKQCHYTLDILNDGKEVKWQSRKFKTMKSRCEYEYGNEQDLLLGIKAQFIKSSNEIILITYYYGLKMNIIRLNPNKFNSAKREYIISSIQTHNVTFCYGSDFRNLYDYT